MLACDAGNLHAHVPSTCTHTVSKLSSQLLFDETEALRASGLGSRSHSSDSALHSWVLTAACTVLSVFHIYYLSWPSQQPCNHPYFSEEAAVHREGK